MELTHLEKRLLNDFQRDLPLSQRPYADMAEQLGVSEQEVIDTLERLRERGVVSRVGAVFRPHSVGVSTLAAMAVPEAELERVAEAITAYPHVNHNYEREHEYNLWFVVTAKDESELCGVLEDMERSTGLSVLALPLLEDYHIDLGFDLQWT
ncbi:AsnC family protein [Thioalkalivibrio denitrificans]|uniref:siroheme decarboxylase n=1 Tax=Thioalkalivibrio denitrificans TaxID=108003 RepID=A0A1V3NKT0_9GAMM|nr:AsnC family transcriptional regulator [Thioalkalivibrio denitrificans]OOG25727.1 AsnC family protein [Thioalkalivibrio denitrificans]